MGGESRQAAVLGATAKFSFLSDASLVRDLHDSFEGFRARKCKVLGLKSTFCA